MNEKDAAIIDLLKRDDGTNARLSTRGKWLVYDNFYERWAVYEQPYGQKVKRILLTSDLQEALLTLVQE